jgi:predicted NBD/HSP70 family sugar kinase
VLIADLRGVVIGRVSRPVPEGLSAVQRLGVLVEAVRSALEEADVPLSRLHAACVGVSGIIGHDGKINRSYFVPEWNNSDIVGRISAELGCSVVLENDIKLAAYAEHHVGAAQLASDSVYFQLGENIAFAITIKGRIHQGAHRSAGELASLRGMRWTRNAVRGVLTWQTAHSLLGVVDEAEKGADAAAEELDAFIADIAARVVTVALVLDPDLIIVGGEISARDYFMERLCAEIDRLTLLDAKPGVVASSLGQDGTLIGALALAFKECSAELYGTPGVPVPELVVPESDSAGAEVGT